MLRSVTLLLSAAVALTFGPFGAARAQTVTADGWDSYADKPSNIACRGRPVLLTGSHTDLTLSGPCRLVRLTGSHNDVVVTVVPGGTIEITGGHNDVFWHPLDPKGVKPVLLDHGESNTFHKRVEEE